MALPGKTREQLIAEQQQRRNQQVGSPTGGSVSPQSAAPGAQAKFRLSPWGTRITTPKGSSGDGFPFYDYDEHDIPVPGENMTEQEFEQYFRDLGELSPPVSSDHLKGPWKAAIDYAWKRMPRKQNIPAPHARLLFENFDPE